MTSTRHDIPRLAGRWARRATAWTLCLATLGLATTAAFRSVEAWARPAFGARVKACDHRVCVGGFQWPDELSDGLVVRQEFDVGRDGLAGLRLQTVTWRHVPDAHACTWSLLEITADGRSGVDGGSSDQEENHNQVPRKHNEPWCGAADNQTYTRRRGYRVLCSTHPWSTRCGAHVRRVAGS